MFGWQFFEGTNSQKAEENFSDEAGNDYADEVGIDNEDIVEKVNIATGDKLQVITSLHFFGYSSTFITTCMTISDILFLLDHFYH